MLSVIAASVFASTLFQLQSTPPKTLAHDPKHSYIPINNLDLDAVPGSPYLHVSIKLTNWDTSSAVDFTDFGSPTFYLHEGTAFIFNDPAEPWTPLTPVAGPLFDPNGKRAIYVLQLPDSDMIGFIWVNLSGFRTDINGKPDASLGEEDTFLVAPFPASDSGSGGRPGVILPISFFARVSEGAVLAERSKSITQTFQIADKFNTKGHGWDKRDFSKPKFYELSSTYPAQPGQPWQLLSSTVQDPSGSTPQTATVSFTAASTSTAYLGVAKQTLEARSNKRYLYYSGFIRKI